MQTLTDNAESMSDGTAHASTQTVLPLEPGKHYRFGVGLASNDPVTVNTGYCQGTVTILKTARRRRGGGRSVRRSARPPAAPRRRP